MLLAYALAFLSLPSCTVGGGFRKRGQRVGLLTTHAPLATMRPTELGHLNWDSVGTPAFWAIEGAVEPIYQYVIQLKDQLQK